VLLISRVIPITIYDSFLPPWGNSRSTYIIIIYSIPCILYMRSLQPLCKSRNNSVYYVAAKLSDGMGRRFNFGLFCYCCGLVVNLYRKNRNPAINLLVGKSQLCTLCYGVTCARPRNRGKTN